MASERSEAMFGESWLQPRVANFQPLTPVDFLVRALEAFPDRPAMEWNGRRWTYRQFGVLVGRLAAQLADRGIGRGDVVSVMAPNRPEMLAAHYAVPMLGAVLNTVNTRLDADTVGYIIDHAGSGLLLSDSSCLPVAAAATRATGKPLLVLAAEAEGDAAPLDLFADGPALPIDARNVTDEWQALCVNYTSGTTGRPKGVVYHHRGAYLNALGNVVTLGLNSRSIYLWTLPMFHCNGWCHTWAVTAAGGLHVCLERPEPAAIFEAAAMHGVTHFCCAPVVLYMLLDHPGRGTFKPTGRVKIATGGAAPTTSLIAALDAIGFDLMHLYGLTESFGPASLCEVDEAAGLSADGKAEFLARQGIRHATASRLRVVGEDGADVPADGTGVGEIVLRGNTLMAGYLHDADATEAAFRDGFFHTGDLAVMHPDGYVEIKDRSKDIIISGGENVSSLEVEAVLHRHPAVLLAAVVAAPDPKWGEIPCAFIELKDGASADPEELRRFCRTHLAGFKVPRRFVFHALPKTATGKIQKFALREEARSAPAARLG